MSPEEFEKQLQQRPIRGVPPDWRAGILAAAKTAASAAPGEPAGKLSLLSTFNTCVSAFFRLRPKALAGLATVWVLILILHFSTHDESPAVANTTAVSPEVIAEARERRLFYAELVGVRETRDAEPPKSFSPKPRSEGRYLSVTA